MADFDGSKFLSLENAQLTTRSDSGLLPDGTLQILHPSVAVGSVNEAVTWIKANRLTLDGSTTAFSIDHNTFSDKWRLLAVSHAVNKDKNFVTLTSTYSRIYDTALVWENARVLAGEDGSDHTGGTKFQSVEFKNLDRDQVPTLLASVRGQTYPSGFTVGGGPVVTGEWVVLAASHRWDEDGSGIIVLHLGDPESQMAGFRNKGLPNEQEIIWHWNIPKKDAQAFINGFSTEGNSVSASKGNIPGTVDITVASSGDASPEFAMEDVRTACDVKTSTFFEFNLTESAAMKFADSYKLEEEGKQSSVRLSYDENTGRFNATAIVTTAVMDESEFFAEIRDSEKTKSKIYFRWKMSEAGLQQFLQGADGDAFCGSLGNWNEQDGRKRKTVAIQRNPDCTYDVRATETESEKTVVSHLNETLHSSEQFDYHFRCTEAEKDEILDGLSSTGEDGLEITGRRDISVSRAGDDSYQVRVTLTREKELLVPNFTWKVGTVSNSLELNFGMTQQDALDKLFALPRDGVSYAIGLSRGGDGTFDLSIRSTKDPGDKLTATIGNIAHYESYDYKFGVEKREVEAAFAALGDDGTSDSKNLRLRRNTDGSYDFSTIKSTVKDFWAEWPTGLGRNYETREKRHWGKTAEQIPGITFRPGTEQTIEASRDSQGSFTYSEKTRTTDPWFSDVFTISWTPTQKKHAQIFKNLRNVPSLPYNRYGTISVEYDASSDTYSGTLTWLVRFIRRQGPEEFQSVLFSYSIDNHVWRQAKDGRPALWVQPIEISVLQTLSASQASGHVSGGIDGSRVTWTGLGYRAVRVTTDEPTPKGWAYGVAP